MYNYYFFNGLRAMIKKIEEMSAETPIEITWFGNGRDVILVNEALKEKNIRTMVKYIIDNDSTKWGSEMGEVYDLSYYQNFFDMENREKVYIHSPKEIIENNENMYFVIISKYSDSMKKQLLSYGIREERLLIIDREKWLSQQTEIKDKISKGTKIDLRQRQMVEVGIMKEFHRFCHQEGLKYYLSSGSLLGAVRHKGFIPWDDDMDVYMPYEDYIRFMKTYPKTGRYQALSWEICDKYFLPFGKITDTETMVFHDFYPLFECNGLYIDIFPLGGYDPEHQPEEFWERNKELEKQWVQYYCIRDIFGDRIPDIRPDIYKERYEFSYYESEMVGARHLIPKIAQWCVPRKIYENTVEVEFEKEMFDAPQGWDELLKVRYGDYMKLPPKEQQHGHYFDAYILND